MAPSRNIPLIIHFILDRLLPPVIRDSRVVMGPLFYLAFGKKAALFLEFKEKLPSLSDQQINDYYEELDDVFIQRDTDLNRACIEYIDTAVEGESVLDVACGNGFLSRRLATQGKEVTGVDIVIPEQNSENPEFLKAEIISLPFPDKEFDTVVCTHTLEHVRDVSTAIHEITRVCKKRLIVVVPCQRECRYSFDLHIHFFPYEYKLRELLGTEGELFKLSGDFLYVRDFT